MTNFTEGLKKLAFYHEDQALIESIKTKYGDILFAMYGETTEFRVRTLFTKEPETIAWIDTFESDEILWDIGANIGCYSLYAAKKGIVVQAFEPAPVNFWLLNRNVAINKFRKVTIYPFALSNRSEIFFWEPNPLAGTAENQLLKEGKSCCVQAYTIDELAKKSGVQFPTHIKLDVDGIENLILEGATDSLRDKRVRSLICEVTEGNPETEFIVDFARQMGFNAPVTRHPPYYDKNHYAPSFNYLFIK